MNVLSRALNAESLKIKRTLALWLALLTPAALVFLEVAAATQRQGNLLQADVNHWQYMFEHMLSIWVILILPLFITLETALLGQLEHGNHTWKLTHTQPIPRWATMAAKQIWGLGLVTLGMLALIGLTLVGGAAHPVGGDVPAGRDQLPGGRDHPGDPYLDRAALAQLCNRQRDRDRDDACRVDLGRARLDRILSLVAAGDGLVPVL
jgi:hypothetical protein